MINSINVALDRIIDRADYVQRHKELAKKVRDVFINSGFNIYANKDYSNTLTAIKMPEGIDFDHMFNYLKDEKNILIGGSIAEFNGKLFRIGHMGENAKDEHIYIVLKALDEYFKHMNLTLEKSLHIEFAKIK